MRSGSVLIKTGGQADWIAELESEALQRSEWRALISSRDYPARGLAAQRDGKRMQSKLVHRLCRQAEQNRP